MISDEIKEKVLKEKNLNIVLKILEPYKGQQWDEEIMKHIQEITPDDEIGIDTFSYLRPDKRN